MSEMIDINDEVELTESFNESRLFYVTGMVFHPKTHGAIIVVISDGTSELLIQVDRCGKSPRTGEQVIRKKDTARKIWNQLDEDLRYALVAAFMNGQKIRVIRYLRSVTGFSITDAKRALETFQP